MTNPNALIKRHGETVDLERVTNAAFDEYDELDKSASTVETVTVEAFISQPNEKELTRLEGKASMESLKATVDSSIDIESDRLGGGDIIIRDGTRYKVAEVRRDTHPMVDIEKTTAFLDPRAGRE
jgi:hypothetical protein